MFLKSIKFINHPILSNLEIDFTNHSNGKPYPVIVFVGENCCGKTTVLSEIFNYCKSPYIVDKEQFDLKMSALERPVSLFIRQDSKFCGAMNELTKVISGGTVPFPTSMNNTNDGDAGYLNYYMRNLNYEYLDINDFIGLFGDEKLLNAGKSNDVFGIKYSGEVMKLIDGSVSSIDLNTYSSGEQELLLKIREIRKTNASTDFILLDEPETSLHPRWQKNILKNIIRLLQPEGNDSSEPQIFVATHSEKILESVINNENVLIIRLSKNNGIIVQERIEQMDLVLPHPTFAELDCIVFNIVSFEYHNELFSCLDYLISSKTKKSSVKSVDDYILLSQQYSQQKGLLTKKWKADGNGSNTKTLPCYIRNYFHHHREDRSVSDEELISSIHLLRTLIKEFEQ